MIHLAMETYAAGLRPGPRGYTTGVPNRQEVSVSESSSETNPAEAPDQETEGSDADGAEGTLSEEEYALGRTSDPDGAEREEPAGEDYAGSGF